MNTKPSLRERKENKKDPLYSDRQGRKEGKSVCWGVTWLIQGEGYKPIYIYIYIKERGGGWGAEQDNEGEGRGVTVRERP